MINTEKQMFNPKCRLCSLQTAAFLSRVHSQWGHGQELFLVSKGGPQFPHHQCSCPQDGLVHKMDRRRRGRVDVEKGVAGPRGTARDRTSPLVYMVWGVKRLESWKHWEAIAWEARFRAGLRAVRAAGFRAPKGTAPFSCKAAAWAAAAAAVVGSWIPEPSANLAMSCRRPPADPRSSSWSPSGKVMSVLPSSRSVTWPILIGRPASSKPFNCSRARRAHSESENYKKPRPLSGTSWPQTPS